MAKILIYIMAKTHLQYQ